MYIALTLHLLWTLGAAAVITRRQRIPASAAAWLALVFLLPVAGTLLYVLAGYRRAVPAAESCDCRGDAVEQIVARGCGTRPAPRNSVSLLHNGSNAFTALIAALLHDPQLLVLDEPVSGVDQKGLQLFLDTVLRLKEKHHMAILLVSHDLRLVRKYADHVVLLDKTVLAQGSPADVFATPEFSAVFGTGEEAEG